MSRRNEKPKDTALTPRKPSPQFIKVFQSHIFDDRLRPIGHKNKRYL